MSHHAPAHTHAVSSGGSKLQLGNNLAVAGNQLATTATNAAKNATHGIFHVWKRVVGRVGDILLKKPVSAGLHIVGGPVAKILDSTFSRVLKILSLGHSPKVQPIARILQTTNTAVASVVDSVSDIKPQWNKREWHGFRGYFRHVSAKMGAWRKSIKESHAQKKAQRAAKKAATSESHSHSDHHGSHGNTAHSHATAHVAAKAAKSEHHDTPGGKHSSEGATHSEHGGHSHEKDIDHGHGHAEKHVEHGHHGEQVHAPTEPVTSKEAHAPAGDHDEPKPHAEAGHDHGRETNH